MADRLPQSSYSLLQNFNPSMLPQQHNQQQPQPNQPNQLAQNSQQQVGQLQDLQQAQVGNMPMENARLWQQMQQQLPHFQGAAQGMDNATRMAELIRTRNLNQLQQQQQQQHQQQQFTLGVNPLGTHPPHQAPFHDQSSAQPNMPPGFPGVGLGGSMTNGNMAALRALQARQLGLMTMAQNQQNQNGPVVPMGDMARIAHVQSIHREQAQPHQQRDQQQISASQPDIFAPPSLSTPDGIRRSPSHASPQPSTGAIPQSMPPNADGSQPTGAMPARRMMTLNELRERANQLRTFIHAGDQQVAQLAANRSALPEQTYMQKLQHMQNDLKNKREYLAKLTAAIYQGQLQSMGGIPNPFPAPGQSNGWMNPVGGNPGFAAQQGQQHPNAPQSGLQGLQSPAHLHAQASQMLSNGVVPPRSGPTPSQQQREQMQKEQQQRLGPPFSMGGQISPPPGASHPFGFGVTGGPSTPSNVNALPNVNAGGTPVNRMPSPAVGPLPPPLSKPRFDDAYANFCKGKGIQHDQRLMSVEGRPIDLFSLHHQVLTEGGAIKVTQRDLWAVIGGRMGFVAFPGSDSEPARSGPQTATQLSHVYKEYLSAFDQVYISSVMEKRRQMMNSGGPTPSDLGGQSANVPRPGLTPAQMQQMIGYASLSAAELRARGVGEKMIQFVEQHRANLQRTTAGQVQFREQLRPGIPPVPGFGPGGLKVGPHPSVPGSEAEAFGQGANVPPQAFVNAASQGGNPLARPLPGGPMGNGNSLDLLVLRSDPQFTNSALKLIHQLKESIPSQLEQLHTATASVTAEQRVEYNSLVEQVFRSSQEFDGKLPMFFVLLRNEEMIRKLVAINYTITTQRTLLAAAQPRLVIGLDNLRSMSGELAKAKEIFQVTLTAFLKSQRPPPGSNGGPIPGPSAPGLPAQSVIPNMPQPQPHSSQPIPPSAVNRPPAQQRPPHQTPKSKPPIQSTANPTSMSAPTPPATIPANAPTPAASASSPVPTTNSPQVPKSPKTKAPQKSKASQPAPSKGRRLSKVGQASPVPAAAEPPRPPSTSAGTKRQREEDSAPSGSNVSSTPQPSGSATATTSSSSLANEASPPKRMKTEWDAKDGPIMEDDADRQAIQNIKTPEDASAFMEQMAELLKLAAGDGQSSITSGISDTLDEILKSCGAPDTDLPIGTLDSSHLPPNSDLQPPASAENEFGEFFDFSSFMKDDDDAGSKAATPDLIPSSSANPSPESNAESDAAHPPGSDVKVEDVPDPLRLGIWKEVDGGESSFYHSSQEWKWDGPMPVMDWPVLS